MLHLLSAMILAAVLTAAPALANGVTVSAHAASPPADVATAVQAKLAPGGVTARVGDVTVDFWWVKTLEAGGKAWSDVPEGALVGAMKVSAVFKDIRGRNIKAGVYLLRFGLQPQNGDHLGVSPHREFLLATPAAEDTDPAALGHDPAVELAAKTINITHPAVFSIDPPAATHAPQTVLQTADGHTAVVFEVGTPGGPLRFGLILVGHIEA